MKMRCREFWPICSTVSGEVGTSTLNQGMPGGGKEMREKCLGRVLSARLPVSSPSPAVREPGLGHPS